MQTGLAKLPVFCEVRGQASQQCFCIGMLRRRKHVCCWTNFSDSASIENKDAMREAHEKSGVVSDQDESQAESWLLVPFATAP